MSRWITVTILETRGSVPRGPGTVMRIFPDGQDGTIGGGALEWTATRIARAMLDSLLEAPSNTEAAQSMTAPSTAEPSKAGPGAKTTCIFDYSVCIRDSETGEIGNCLWYFACGGSTGGGYVEWGADSPYPDPEAPPGGGGSSGDEGDGGRRLVTDGGVEADATAAATRGERAHEHDGDRQPAA